MSNPEYHSESEPDQPDRLCSQFDILTKWIAELIATGEIDPSTPLPTGDGSTLPPPLREMVQKWLQEQEQANNSTPPDTPPPLEPPQ